MVRTMKRRMKVLHSHFPDIVVMDRPMQTDPPSHEVTWVQHS